MAGLKRGMMSLLMAVAVTGLLPLTAVAASAVAPDPGGGRTTIDGVATSDSIVVGGHHKRKRSGDRDNFAKLSYRPVCIHKVDVDNLGACPISTSWCGGTISNLVPAWTLTRPAGLTSADDWVNTGQVTCLKQRSATSTATVSAEQFRRLPIPAPKIIVQPDPAISPTLVNIDTNVFSEKQLVTLTTTVLGQAVRVRAVPAQFSWQYGDGSQLTTTNPGGRYPNLSTAHAYRQAGTYTVQLQCTFTGEFSVRGGPWQPIIGTASTTSPSVNITAEERRAVLTS